MQASQRVLGTQQGEKFWPQLKDANIPFDADGTPRRWQFPPGMFVDPRTNKPNLNEGDRLLVPTSWPEGLPGVTTEKVGVPNAAISGDVANIPNDDLRRLAGRVATEVLHSPKGSENRDLIATFQAAEAARGRRQGDTRGLYDAETAACLAMVHAIAPPTRFADGAEIYWPDPNAGPAKQYLRDMLGRLAHADVARREEFLQSIAGIQ